VKIRAQRRSNDCGVAALASYIGTTYEDAYAAAVVMSKGFVRGQGLSIPDMMAIAEVFGRPLKKVHWRRVDLDGDSTGILGINWHRSTWRIHGCQGHWVVLRRGTIIDPSGGACYDAHEYLAINRGRAGTMLSEAD